MSLLYLTENTVDFDGVTYDAGTCKAGGKDANIASGAAADSNDGGQLGSRWSSVAGTGGAVYRYVSKFSTNNIPASATINSVVLKFCSNGTFNIDCDLGVYRISDPHDFVEGNGVNFSGDSLGGVTWNSYSTGNAWGTAGIAHDATELGTLDDSATYATDTWGAFTETSNGIKTYVQNIANGTTDYGLVFKGIVASGEGLEDRWGNQGTNGKRPYLKVDYTEGSPPAVGKAGTQIPLGMNHGMNRGMNR